MVRPSRKIIYPVISTDINAKYSIAHSHALGHGPYIRRSDLANCNFTLVLVLIKQAQYRTRTAL